MNPTKRARTSSSVSVCGLRLDPYGLGTLPLGIEYPEPEKRPSRIAALALLHTAFRSGVQLLDTADSYCAGPGGSAEASAPHYVERLISDAIRTYTGDSTNIRVCTKGGMRRVDSSSRGWRPKGCTAPIVRRMILDSHAALGGKRPIDIYMLHHTDTLSTHQLEDALKEMQAAVDEGLVLCLGLANATVAHIEVAVRLRIDLAVVQNQYSLWHRDPELPRPRDGDSKNKRGVVNFCASLGIAFMPYGVFGGVRSRDGRLSLRQSFPQLVEMARQKNTSPESIVLAWMRHRFPHILHIPGVALSRETCASRNTRSITFQSSNLWHVLISERMYHWRVLTSYIWKKALFLERLSSCCSTSKMTSRKLKLRLASKSHGRRTPSA
eukprot:TRINITY_DN18799_c0_g1_i1.p1 TRINITY_DN18799_c0_g1~~TRINITY_DN18799_c0_g1_i1.p1  ORF type:complete len:381 (+),score=18.80 TRINITY_DN18799_c0_g1_i1:149-1291(+)